MQTKAFYTERPEPIHYMPLPTGEGDVWLRKNITETADPENGVFYEADETYMRTGASEEDITADFEGFYETAAAWQMPQTERKPTPEERIAALEKALESALALVQAQTVQAQA